MYLYRDYSKAKVYAICVHGSLGLGCFLVCVGCSSGFTCDVSFIAGPVTQAFCLRSASICPKMDPVPVLRL